MSLSSIPTFSFVFIGVAAIFIAQLNPRSSDYSFPMAGLVLILLAMVQTALASTATPSSRRFAVTKSPPPHTYPLAQLAAASSDKDKFLCLYPQLQEELCEWFATENEMTPEAVQWIREMLDYNVPGGKLNRGTTVLAVYRALKKGAPISEHEYAQAAVLGWTIEFLQAFFLVADDIMDDSQTRRGQPCWYKNQHVNLVAINDSFLLESAVFCILKRHFGNEPYYTELLELLLQTTQQTELGQLLDLTSQPQGNEVDLNRFTMQRYKLIVKYKTAFYSFYLPVALGMILAGNTDEASYQAAKEILLNMGEYFQVQDDYLDCFGDPSVIGKVGTDIQDNKCSWLVVQALERCNEEEKNVLRQNYGAWDDQKVETIKELYRTLDLPNVFAQYEEDSYQRIQKALDEIDLPRDVFEILLNKIYKRSK
ncbi:farnesyl diphosphate synthase [Fistulifera solaris]|uniref:Farnesyl diphosphate synthase n=1 Tax=Fistulifera solaris TaxID=1519565 RepID=A0A1Z5K194_FISSO|nr:farnesyl diphosphate synthase [Fistulifera solaris]|eukprot:GAX20074.1 farnesyl diphosphate synthase [Fistulifera solaris]